MVNTNSVLSSILFSQTIDWNIKQFFSSTSINSSFELKRIGKAITRRKDQMVVEDDKRYKRITIKTNCGGVFVRDEVLGKDIKTKKQYYVKAGQLAVSKIDARNGAFGIVPPEADGAIITGNFWVYDVNPEIANIDYLILLLSSNVFVQAWQDCSNGSGNRLYLQEEKFLNYKIPMPEADVQKDLIRKYNTQLAEAKKDQDSIDNLQYQIEQYILKKLGISFKRSSFNGLIGTPLTIDFELGNGLTMLVGNNGSGKSNVLEAISGIFHDLFKGKDSRKIKCDYKLQYTLNEINCVIEQTNGFLRCYGPKFKRRE